MTNLVELILRLARLFESVGASYVFVGSVASSKHGFPRATNDVDLLTDLSLEQVPDFIKAINDEFYFSETSIKRALQLHRSFNLIHLDSMFKVDVFSPHPDSFGWQNIARKQANAISSDSAVEVFIATAEDTLLAKLEWFKKGGGVSDRQWSDVLGIIKVKGDNLDDGYLRTWAGQLNLLALLEKAYDEGREDE